MRIAASSCILLLAAAGAGQAPVTGTSEDPLARIAPAAAAIPGAKLCLLLPAARRPARAALWITDRIAAQEGPALPIVVVWPDKDAPGRLGRRGPTGASEAVDPGGMLRAALAEELPGEDAVGAWWDGEGRLVLVEPFDDGARHVAADLRSGGALGAHWRPWVAEVARSVDTRAVRDALDRARRALDGRPEFLAHVLEAAVRCDRSIAEDPTVRRLGMELLERAPRCEAAQRAAFVVCHASGNAAGARAAAFAWIESVKGRAGAARALVDELQGARGSGWEDDQLIDLALEVAAAAAPGDLGLLRARFEHRFLALNDTVGADRAGRELVDAIGADAQALNSLAWKLLTRAPYAGALDPLALHAARGMTHDPEWRTYWRIDTLALACFRNGQIGEAVELQREAVDGADTASRPRYQERLDEYTAALAAAATPPGPPSR